MTFTYDAVSQRLAMSEIPIRSGQDSTGTTTFTYDAVRRINTVTYPANKMITYSYDAVGSRTLMIDPDNGRTTYSYDAANNLLTLLNPFGETTTFTYDALNRAVTITRSNTTTEQSFFNAAGWMTAIRHQKSDATVLSGFTYTYDNVGNRLTMAEANGDRVTWTYDAIYELTNERRSGTNAYNTTYTYDATGNRLTKVDGGTTITTYSYDSGNRLLTEQTGAPITTYSFDNNGNTTLKNAAGQLTTYTWDGENRMTKLQQPTSPAVMTFTYNGLSFRRTLHDGTNLTKFIYAWETGTPGLDPALIESDVNDITVVEYTPALMLALLSQRRSNVSKWYHAEAIGSIRQLTDNTQTPTDTYLYKAFGEEVAVTGTTVNPLRYVGAANYYTDGKSGLMLLGVRCYDARIGIFTTRDPARRNDNWYMYANGRPTVERDPSGLWPLDPTTWCDKPCRVGKDALCCREVQADWQMRGFSSQSACTHNCETLVTWLLGLGSLAGTICAAQLELLWVCSIVAAIGGGGALGYPIGCDIACGVEMCTEFASPERKVEILPWWDPRGWFCHGRHVYYECPATKYLSRSSGKGTQ